MRIIFTYRCMRALALLYRTAGPPMSYVVFKTDIEGGSVIRCFKKPVIIANTGYRKGLSQKLGSGKPEAFFLHIPTGRGGRSASPPEFSASYFSRKFSDLETPIYRAPLYSTRRTAELVRHADQFGPFFRFRSRGWSRVTALAC